MQEVFDAAINAVQMVFIALVIITVVAAVATIWQASCDDQEDEP